MNEAQVKLTELLADFNESSEELAVAWTAVADRLGEHKEVQRLAQVLARYIAIQGVLKTLAMAVMQDQR